MAYIPGQYFQNIGSNTTWICPAGYYIRDIVVDNKTANAVTGGIKIGTTNGGTEVVLGMAVGANAIVNAGSNILKSVFSTSVDTTLYIQAAVGWNSAVVDIYMLVMKLK